MGDVRSQVDALLALRDAGGGASPDERSRAELVYRGRVMRLLGAEPVPGAGPPDMHRAERRVEGIVEFRDGDAVVRGIVVFAVGNDGRGASADVRSKHARSSAVSLLKDSGAGFVVVVTTVEPHPVLLELASARSERFLLGGAPRPRVWVMGLPEVVARGSAPVVAPRPWWRFWSAPAPALAGPLLGPPPRTG